MALVLTIDLGLFRQPGVEGVYDEDSGVDCTGCDAAGTRVPRTAEIQKPEDWSRHTSQLGWLGNVANGDQYKTRSRCTRASQLRMQRK